MKRWYLLFMIVGVIMVSSLASASFAYNKLPEPTALTNYSTVVTNVSDFWDLLDTPADITEYPFWYNHTLFDTDTNLSSGGEIHSYLNVTGGVTHFKGGIASGSNTALKCSGGATGFDGGCSMEFWNAYGGDVYRDIWKVAEIRGQYGSGLGSWGGYADIQVNDGSGASTMTSGLKISKLGLTVPTGAYIQGASQLQLDKTGTTTTFGSGDNTHLYLGGTSSIGANKYNHIGFGYGTLGGTPASIIGYQTTVYNGQTKGDLVFGTRDVITATNPTERMRIDSGGNITMTGTLDVAKNFTGESIYAEMWGEDIGNRTLAVQSTYYNITNITNFVMNGFENTSTSTLISQVAGKYRVVNSVSFSGFANNEYHATLSVNSEKQSNCHFERMMGSGGDVGSASFTCFVDLLVGDNVHIQAENDDGANEIDVHDINLNLVRIGD